MVKSGRGAWLFDGEEWREDRRKDGKIFSCASEKYCDCAGSTSAVADYKPPNFRA